MARQKAPKALKSTNPDLSSLELIVDAYISLTYDIGVSQITIQKIADRAGVAFSTVRYYFQRDDFDIHAEAFKRVMSKSLETVQAGLQKSLARSKARFQPNPVHLYVDSMFDWITDDPVNSNYLIYAYYNAAAGFDSRVDLTQVQDAARRKVQSALLESIGLEIYAPVKDVSGCALSIHACVVGHGFIAMTAKSKEALKLFRSQCVSTVEALIQTSARPS